MSRLGVGGGTRYELVRTRQRLERVRKGRDLLSRKRRALVAELFELASPAAAARIRVAAAAESAHSALLGALAVRDREDLRAVGWPDRRVRVEVRDRSVWGVAAATIVGHPAMSRTPAARGTAPSLTGPAAAAAAAEFERLVELLLEVASREDLIRRLADALARTTRQVNTLERRVGPALEERIRSMVRALDEREREEHARLRHLLRSRRQSGRGP